MFKTIFFNISLAFVLASFFYIVYTKAAHFGTPLRDSLTPEQRVIKRASASRRRNVFLVSFGLALMVVWFSAHKF